MSHYFQQLLTSSGLASPSPAPVPSRGAAAPLAPAAIREISAESVALPVSPPTEASLRNHPQLPTASSPQSKAVPKHTEVSTELSAGIVEISQTHSAGTQPTKTIGAQPSTPVSSTPKPTRATAQTRFSAEEAIVTVEKNAAPSASKPNEPGRGSGEKSGPTPTREELIQHVFRWVGQNPANVTPPALNPVSQSDEPSVKTKPIPPSVAKTTATTAAPSTSIIPTVVPPPAFPALNPARPRPPAPTVAATSTQESSVEISIGTLQIQVEAPPAAPKPLRRPVAPRSTAPAAVAQRPAIDINRLRRGFYL